MRRLWCLIGVLATLQYHTGATFAGMPPREPLVYYQLLFLSFLTRSACGDDIHGWPDDLQAIREILKKELGYSDQKVTAVEAKANELRLAVPCDSDASRDLLDVTMDEPHVALRWFRAQKTLRNP
jgi:hypothetical protein